VQENWNEGAKVCWPDFPLFTSSHNVWEKCCARRLVSEPPCVTYTNNDRGARALPASQQGSIDPQTIGIRRKVPRALHVMCAIMLFENHGSYCL
jgi:hypothetical protein